MEKLKELWQKHPYLIAGGVFLIGAALIWLFFRGRGGAVASDDSAYYAAQASAIGSANNLAAIQAGLVEHANTVSAQVANLKTQTAADISLANVAKDVSLDTNAKAVDITKYLVSVPLGQQATDVSLADISAKSSLDLLKEYTSGLIKYHQLDTDVTQTQAENEAYLRDAQSIRDFYLNNYQQNIDYNAAHPGALGSLVPLPTTNINMWAPLSALKSSYNKAA